MGPGSRPPLTRAELCRAALCFSPLKVGKTSLMKRYVSNDFTDRRQPTIGADFMTKEMVAGDQPMLLQVRCFVPAGSIMLRSLRGFESGGTRGGEAQERGRRRQSARKRGGH